MLRRLLCFYTSTVHFLNSILGLKFVIFQEKVCSRVGENFLSPLSFLLKPPHTSMHPVLKGLSHEIDFKNVDENGQILALTRAAAGF